MYVTQGDRNTQSYLSFKGKLSFFLFHLLVVVLFLVLVGTIES